VYVLFDKLPSTISRVCYQYSLNSHDCLSYQTLIPNGPPMTVPLGSDWTAYPVCQLLHSDSTSNNACALATHFTRSLTPRSSHHTTVVRYPNISYKISCQYRLVFILAAHANSLSILVTRSCNGFLFYFHRAINCLYDNDDDD
jgi:hypothetical protein